MKKRFVASFSLIFYNYFQKEYIMLKYKTKQKMLSKASAFLDIQNQYFADKKSDAYMTQITTQPFWQSMRLSKMRL